MVVSNFKNKYIKKTIIFAIIFVFVVIAGWLYLYYDRSEIYELKKTVSPNGEWVAKYMTSLTHLGMGGSDLTAYIEIASTKNKNNVVTVYAVTDDIRQTNFEWKSDTELIILDNYRNIEYGAKFKHPTINIEYKINQR